MSSWLTIRVSFLFQDNGNDDDKEVENGDDGMSDAGVEAVELVEELPINNNKEADEKQQLNLRNGGKKKNKNSTKNGGQETTVSVVDEGNELTSKRKDSTELESSSTQTSLKKASSPPTVTSTNYDDPSQPSTRGSKRKKENAPTDVLILPPAAIKTTAAITQRNGTESIIVVDTLKEVNNLPSTLKPLSPTSVTSPKRPIKREEGWKEVVRRGPVSSRENSSSNLGSSAAAKKGQSSDRSTATLSVIASSERSKKVTVPSNAISRVIGRAGCNINAIREISGAHIEIEKQGKGQGDRTVLIKGTAESIRQSQQLITALIKEPEKEFNELMAKFRAANAAAKAGVTAAAAPLSAAVTAAAVTKTSTAPSALQAKVTRSATTIAPSKPVQTAPASGLLAPVPSTVAWGAINTLIVAASSPKRPVPLLATGKTTPVPSSTSSQSQLNQQLQQQQSKSGAVRQLFPENPVTNAANAVKKPSSQSSNGSAIASSGKPAVSYTVAGGSNSAPITSSALSTRTTPVVSTTASPVPVKPVPQLPAGVTAAKITEKVSPTPGATSTLQAVTSAPQSTSAPPGQQIVTTSSISSNPSTTLSSRPSSTSPVQDYSPFNNLFSKTLLSQQSLWAKEQQQQQQGSGQFKLSSSSKNFASVAAAGVSPVPTSKIPATSVSNERQAESGSGSGPSIHVVDVAKAPGYRGSATNSSQLQNEIQMMQGSSMDIPTSLTSSAPGTPIPSSGPIRPPVGSRMHPLTPPPRIGTPPLFNPTPIQPLGPIGARHMMQSNSTSVAPPDSIMVPPPSAASLAPGGPSAVRMRAARMQHEPPPSQQQSFEGMPMAGFYGMNRPVGPMGGNGSGAVGDSMQRPAPSFPLAPGMGGPPRYNYYRFMQLPYSFDL